MDGHTGYKNDRSPALPEEGRAGDRGAALITALLFLVLLTALGLASIMTSSTELLIARNDRLNKLAVDHANAGVSMAIAALDSNAISYNLKAYDITSAHEFTWHLNEHGYTDNVGAAVTLSLGDIYYYTTVYYRREDILHYRNKETGGTFTGGPDDPEIVGYSKDCGYNKAPISTVNRAYPVHVIESTGYVKANDVILASAKVVTEVSKNSINVDVPGALYSSGDLHMNGNVALTGGTNCPGGDAKEPYVVPATATIDTAGGSLDIEPLGGGETDGPVYDLNTPEAFLGMTKEELIEIARGMGQYWVESDPVNWAKCPGSPGQPKDFSQINDFTNETNPQIVYVKPNVEYTLPTNSQNYGILFVEGNLRSAGNAEWKGLIYCTGALTAAAGTITVTGGVMSGSTTTISGGVDITYDCALLEGIADKAFSTKLINWRRDYEQAY